jgi:CRISPR system Cascade subunit CasB
VSSNQSDLRETATRLLGYLRQFKNDRGAMADLRCALSPTRLPRAWPLLGRVGGIGNRSIETVAGLFGYHPDETDTGNIGTTCRLLAAENRTFDSRFRRLLSCDHRHEVCERMRPIILAAKAKGVKVNYEELFIDLYYWGDSVKARWASEYWGVRESEEPPVATGATT